MDKQISPTDKLLPKYQRLWYEGTGQYPKKQMQAGGESIKKDIPMVEFPVATAFFPWASCQLTLLLAFKAWT